MPNSSPPSGRATSSTLLTTSLLLFLSGASALVYEVAAVRLLTRTLGGSTPAVATVLAVFFVGLAGGAAAAGRWVRRAPRPLLVYSALEAAVAAYAIATPALADLLERIYLGIGAGGLASRALASALLLAPPTFAMGATLPFAIRGSEERREGSSVAGLLYGTNTAGGVAGTILAGFVLLENLGLRGSLLCAALASATAAVGAFLVDRTLASRAPGAPRAIPKRVPAVPLALAAAAGALSLAAENLYARLLSQVLGGTVYAFASMLASFLAGIALGSILVAPLLPRLRDPAGSFSLLALAMGVLFALAPAALPRIAAGLGGAPPEGFGDVMGRTALVCLLLLLPVGVVSGASFPVLVRLAIAARADLSPAAATARLYAANTLGAVAGSLVGGFVLLPSLGSAGGMAALAAGSIVLAVAARPTWVALPAAGALLLLAPWRADLLSLRLSLAAADAARYGRERPPERIYSAEGASATVAVYDEEWGRTLRVNGKVVASTAFIDARNQFLLGHLPALLHPDPRAGLVIGLGTGMTAGALAVHPGMNVVVAEWSREVASAAERFADRNHDVLRRPGVRLAFDDGRHVLLSSPATYDVITSDPLHPWVAGAANLYSRDFLSLVRARLRPGGVAAQWLPLYEMGPGEARAIVATFGEAFEHVALWLSFHDAILLGSDRPIEADAETLALRMRATPGVLDDLASVDLQDPERFLSLLVAADGDLRAFAAGAPVVTDDRQILEFRAARAQHVLTVGENLLALADLQERTWTASPPATIGPRLERVRRATTAFFRAQALLATRDLPRAAEAVLASWVEDPEGPRIPWAKVRPALLGAFDSASLAGAPGAYARGVVLWQEAKAALRGAGNESRSLLERAERAFAGALDAGASGDLEVAIRRERAKVLGELGRFEDCLAEAGRAIEIEPELAVLHRIRAIAFAGKGRLPEAIEALDAAERLDGGAADTSSLRGTILEATGDREGAARAYREALAKDPRDARARAFLGSP